MGLLSQLATEHKTDKWGHHYYTEHYEKAFCHLRNKPINFLEIGIGGYEFPDRGGASLRMWADYFPMAQITGIDFYDKSGLQMPGHVKMFKGSQADKGFLEKINQQCGPFDIILDDGSHHCGHQIYSFETLFPLLKADGIYVIEDTETSYWPDYSGSKDLDDKNTCIAYFMQKIHELHYRTNGLPKSDFTEHIESIRFFNNIIMIQKGYNA